MGAPWENVHEFWATRPSSRRIEFAALVVALAGHLGLTALRVHAPSVSRAPAQLIDVLLDAAPPPALPEPVIEPPARAEPATALTPTAATRTLAAPAVPSNATTTSDSSPAASAASNPTNEEAAPLLASDSDESPWAMPSGTGTSLGRGGSGPRGLAAGVGRASSLAPRDFSREATPPHLQPYVDRNFPGTARMYKVEGDVVVSVRIDASGAPSDLRVENADPGGRGFGEACSRSVLQGPSWKPKLTKDGTPLATRATYRCIFRLTEAEKAATQPSVGGRVWSYSTGD
ncbi:MAG TPA: energy transducer TonB [Polyangiaceae bacterium]|nr:energy transducer TonB [Polyangiaceae bacterium]